MAQVAEKQMQVMEQQYNDITGLFDLAEELAATVDSKATVDNMLQLRLVEPLIEALGESADILAEEYVAHCEGQAPKKQRIESAIRKVFIAMQEYRTRVARVCKDGVNAADAIVSKVKTQMEKVVANFLVFVKLSLDRMMQKDEIEALKRHNAYVAMMLHQQAIQKGAS